MGIFSEYGRRLDSITKSAIDNYKDAAQKAEIAEVRYNVESDPHKTINNAQQQAVAARAKADMLEAQQATRDAQQFMVKEIDSVRAVGQELQAAVGERFCANGEQVDIGTLELLKSGILKPQEYFSLYSKADKDGNHTMMRLIGKYAGDAAAQAPTQELQHQMESLANNSRHTMGSEYMNLFNAFLDAYSRTANNPAMIAKWDELTAGMINSF